MLHTCDQLLIGRVCACMTYQLMPVTAYGVPCKLRVPAECVTPPSEVNYMPGSQNFLVHSTHVCIYRHQPGSTAP